MCLYYKLMSFSISQLDSDYKKTQLMPQPIKVAFLKLLKIRHSFRMVWEAKSKTKSFLLTPDSLTLIQEIKDFQNFNF